MTRASVISVALNKANTTIGVGKTEQLIPTVSPEEAWNKMVYWQSNNESVATVDKDGVVTGVAPGAAQITVTTLDGTPRKTATCTVKVTDVTGISLSPEKLSLPVDGEITLTAAFSPANAVNKNLIWTSSNTSVATVSSGVVKAKAKGKATITARSSANPDCTATCDVTVDQVSVNLNIYAYELTEGINPTVQLTASVSPSGYPVIWKSSYPAVATVDQSGLVTMVPGAEGYTTVTATAGGVSMSCHITANPIIYRALLIGNSYTKSSYLAGPRFDVDNMETVLEELPTTKYTVIKKKDMDFGDDNLIDAITSAFSSADENDVSLLYYSGHGSSDGSIIGQDDTHISPSSLRTDLDKISGRKVVFADSCYSGKIISKSVDSQADASDDGEGFEEAFLSAFSVNRRSSTDLADTNYYVITASQGSNTSVDRSYCSYIDTTSNEKWPGFEGYKGYYRKGDVIYRFNKDGYAFRVQIDGAAGDFTYSLVRGLGYDYGDRWTSISASDLKADKNGDKQVTFAELYSYVKADMSEREVSHTPQMYPVNSSVVFFAR